MAIGIMLLIIGIVFWGVSPKKIAISCGFAENPQESICCTGSVPTIFFNIDGAETMIWAT